MTRSRYHLDSPSETSPGGVAGPSCATGFTGRPALLLRADDTSPIPRPLRKRSPTAWLRLVAAVALPAVLVGGCGDKAADKPDTYDLNKIDRGKNDTRVGGAEVGDSGAVFRFARDAGEDSGGPLGDSGSALSDGGPRPADGIGLTDAIVAPDAIDATDATAGDAGPKPVTSCRGHCGIFLEGNACHCHSGCESEKNCCTDFAVVCTCQQSKDCNDDNPCTQDTCKLPEGVCKQIPFPNCCTSDAQCHGGTVCKLARCLQGTCSLVDKDCDDGLPCTADLCDAKTGGCSHPLKPNKCNIDGYCADVGDARPASKGCQLCQPGVDAGKWTAKVGTCLIDGQCVAAGTEHPTDKCRVCEPEQAADDWSVKSGHCFVGGSCYVSGQSPPGGAACATCKPTASRTQWSGTPGTCAVTAADGVIECKKSGDPSPAGSCATCDPSKSTTGYTLKAGHCLIAGQCIPNGQSGTGKDVCGVCDTAKATGQWTPKGKGKPCDDGDPCTDATLCNPKGECKGKTIPTCCKSDADCPNQVPTPECYKDICLESIGKCESQKLPPDQCCTTGKCCDLATHKVLPKGTKCSGPTGYFEYRCHDNNEEKRPYYRGCSGKRGAGCSGDPAYQATGPWELGKKCGADAICTENSKDQHPDCKPK